MKELKTNDDGIRLFRENVRFIRCSSSLLNQSEDVDQTKRTFLRFEIVHQMNQSSISSSRWFSSSMWEISRIGISKMTTKLEIFTMNEKWSSSQWTTGGGVWHWFSDEYDSKWWDILLSMFSIDQWWRSVDHRVLVITVGDDQYLEFHQEIHQQFRLFVVFHILTNVFFTFGSNDGSRFDSHRSIRWLRLLFHSIDQSIRWTRTFLIHSEPSINTTPMETIVHNHLICSTNLRIFPNRCNNNIALLFLSLCLTSNLSLKQLKRKDLFFVSSIEQKRNAKHCWTWHSNVKGKDSINWISSFI